MCPEFWSRGRCDPGLLAETGFCDQVPVPVLRFYQLQDPNYDQRANIHEEQDEFARNELVNNLHVEFINLFDRGYRCIVTAFSAGGQTRLQSSFAQSDQRYSSNEILDSGAVAATRSGNERPVRPARQSWVIKRGAAFQPFDFDWLAEQWLAWGCQVHLMYDPVH